jgi:hypothetical protein
MGCAGAGAAAAAAQQQQQQAGSAVECLSVPTSTLRPGDLVRVLPGVCEDSWLKSWCVKGRTSMCSLFIVAWA